MNIVFFGSAKFGYPSLKKLIDSGYDIPLVVTQPDKLKGRGMKPGGTEIKELALQSGLKIFQPADINSPESVESLKAAKADLFVIIAYGQKFSKEVLDIPLIMPVNVHASLLPKYRGAAPISRAIINGDSETGNSIMKVIPKMDAGPVICRSRMPILDEDDALTIENKLSQDAAVLLLDAVKMLESGQFKLQDQDERGVSIAGKLDSGTARIKWDAPADRINNLVRGCVNWSAAFTLYKGKVLKIYKSAAAPAENATGGTRPGDIISVSGSGILVSAGSGALSLRELQLEGKKRLEAKEFLRGNNIRPGEKLV